MDQADAAEAAEAAEAAWRAAEFARAAEMAEAVEAPSSHGAGNVQGELVNHFIASRTCITPVPSPQPARRAPMRRVSATYGSRSWRSYLS